MHCLTWHPTVPGRAYEAGGDGAAWSHDGGVTWDPAGAGRERRYAWALAVDPDDPEVWFVSAAPGPFQAQGSGPSDSAVYRWGADGRWEQVEGPLDSHVYALATADGSLFAGLGDGTLVRSDHRGETWHDLSEWSALPLSSRTSVLGRARARRSRWRRPRAHSHFTSKCGAGCATVFTSAAAAHDG
ncbi:MAG: hypothetical protein ACJ76Z_09380, partial [Thermoleophilaceae bacterium]